MYEIRWDDGAREDMQRMRLRANEVRQIVNAVDEQLVHEPDHVSKRKKVIQERRRRQATLSSDDVRRSFGITTEEGPEGASCPKRPGGVRRAAGRKRK